MSPKLLLAGLLFVAPFIYWSPGLLLNVLLLVLSWGLRAPVTEGNTEQLEYRLVRGDQALSETTEELVVSVVCLLGNSNLQIDKHLAFLFSKTSNAEP
ncbi:hypothetical protein chiPu_0024958 [Chiloscyllium punctatum]|uniref:Uncharacterized protein n=1 Tax=Chiloscyllium punctatum TaxID=137246 RepID=A0A401TDE2_CHIPU|nr:hypothetical protein [Chiloscyllium punctatum]